MLPAPLLPVEFSEHRTSNAVQIHPRASRVNAESMADAAGRSHGKNADREIRKSVQGAAAGWLILLECGAGVGYTAVGRQGMGGRMTHDLLAEWARLHRKLSGLRGTMLGAQEAHGWAPPTDVGECAGGLLVRMELAGVEPRHLRARLEEGALVVEGTRANPCGAPRRPGLRFWQMEMDYGPFRRVVPLPFPVAGAKAEARLAHGLLEVFLPRAARPGGTAVLTVVLSP